MKLKWVEQQRRNETKYKGNKNTKRKKWRNKIEEMKEETTTNGKKNESSKIMYGWDINWLKYAKERISERKRIKERNKNEGSDKNFLKMRNQTKTESRRIKRVK